ncbi:peptidase domain-containing ABC transporter [Chitinophaga nivalis]|uniref:Peptidase domain-containing ABC transporter n=1 Tax=Chitinophaga nivalis TaxID=2991709 RepID=A0ABT3INJ9_9BACT|nr:peptidase domain-containing ABC transporter [Chitinophaga nivalis]MCW3464758.1 peptidase domain-containing ABC transporter [Chitinophaga nivalis]MCW3485551.1 peptidase domain-containing ABC transporter [Chitinophaga nivalis]
MKKFPNYLQYDEMDCGPTCLRIISRYYGRHFSLEYLRSLCHTTRVGSSLLDISEAAEKLGFRTFGARVSFEDLLTEDLYPCIAYWNQIHFIVIYKVRKNKIYVSDPGFGRIVYTAEEFKKGWSADGVNGIILNIAPTPALKDREEESPPKRKRGVHLIASYLFRYRQLLTQVICGLVITSLLQLAFPFLTQSIVDTGIFQHNLSFIYMILLAQLAIFIGKTTVEILRGFILTHLNARINISLLTDFYIKLMNLPLGFFDVKLTGDVLQRIADHQRIEKFLTTGSLSMLFSLINLVIFGIVLAFYNIQIFTVFATGSILYFIWISYFMKRRAMLDYKRFNQLILNQEKNLELIHGMQEIKLHNAERKKRWQWESLQVKLFRINLSGMSLEQLQTSGASLINELKNILISFLAARLVLDGNITLGIMLSVSYIIGQLNAPLAQLLEFMQTLQDAKLSISRINEIHNKPDESPIDQEYIKDVPETGALQLKNVSFKYHSGAMAPWVLRDINLHIPRNRVTAIVGASGSGKTTLLKLLLKFYDPTEGQVTIGDNIALKDIAHSTWRENCGAVLQEGYIFSDAITNNIAVGEESMNMEAVHRAAQIANIHDHITSLPLHYKTKIGTNGMGLSTGQKQRILIARAIYRNPEFLFFDEATSALDANNEKTIMENLNHIFEGKTVVVVAHRLSTVRHADQIIVLEQGQIVETGNHHSLIGQKGLYYNLIRNQLELGD